MRVTELSIPTRVLIVEDDPNIVDLLRSNLAVRGFDTFVSTDGSKALALLETEQPDMVLLDLMLPDAERLGHVIVGAHVERGHLVPLAAAGRHDDDGDG